MTRRPVPPRRPVFNNRARLVRVPGLSLEYQLRISRTRSVMVRHSPWKMVGGWGYHGKIPTASATRMARISPKAAAPATIGPAAMLPFGPYGITDGVELRLRDPSQLERIDLGIAMDAAVALGSRVVEREMRQDIAPAGRTARHRERRGGLRRQHQQPSRPSAASSSRMRA